MDLFLLVICTMLIVKFATARTVIKWNKRSTKFEPLVNSITYEEERKNVMLQSRQQEIQNFNGQPLNFTYYEDLGFFEFYDNDTKVTGICGDIWTLLSEYLNFTLVLTKNAEHTLGEYHKDGTYTGILRYAYLNQTDVIPKMTVFITRLRAVDFAPDFWMNSQRIFAYGQWKRNNDWMFNLFSIDVWALIFAFIVTLSLASIITQRILIRHRGEKLERESFFSHYFYIFATMCNQPGCICSRTGSGSKMLNLMIVVFSLLILVTYNSRLIYSMAAESFEAPFNDLETLMDNTKFRIVVLEGSTAHLTIKSPFTIPIFARILRSKRYTVVTNLNDLYEKVCKYSNQYVMFDSEDAVAVRGKRECRVIPVGIPYYVTPIAAGISRGVKNRRILKIGIMKIREYGLLDAIKKRYVSSPRREQVVRQAESLGVDMDRVSLIFGVLCLGIVVSIIICIAENIIYTLKKRNTAQCPTKRLFTVERAMFINTILRSRGHVKR